jgi:hypothetical protein
VRIARLASWASSAAIRCTSASTFELVPATSPQPLATTRPAPIGTARRRIDRYATSEPSSCSRQRRVLARSLLDDEPARFLAKPSNDPRERVQVDASGLGMQFRVPGACVLLHLISDLAVEWPRRDMRGTRDSPTTDVIDLSGSHREPRPWRRCAWQPRGSGGHRREGKCSDDRCVVRASGATRTPRG